MILKLFSREGKKLFPKFYMAEKYGEKMREVSWAEFEEKELKPEIINKWPYEIRFKELIETLGKGCEVFEVKKIYAARGVAMDCVAFYMVSTFFETFFIRKAGSQVERYNVVFLDVETGEEIFSVSYLDTCWSFA